MLLKQLITLNLTDEQVIRIRGLLVRAFRADRPIPSEPDERVSEAKELLVECAALEPDYDLLLPSAWEAGNNGGHRTNATAAGELGQRSNSQNGASASQQPHAAAQGSGQLSDTEIDDLVMPLAQRCFDQFVEAMNPQLAEFWANLKPAERRAVGEELFANMRADFVRQEFSNDELNDYWGDQTTAELERRYELAMARQRLSAAEASALPVLPAAWLQAAAACAESYRTADLDLRRPVTVLSDAQSAIVNDKALKQAYAPFQLSHLMSRELDRNREKDLRATSEAANRAVTYLALSKSARERPELVDAWLLERTIDACMADLARLSQLAARERAKLVLDKTAVERLSEPEDHIARLPVMDDMAEQLGLKSTEQLFTADRTRKRGRESADEAGRVPAPARGSAQVSRGWRGRGGRGGGRGGSARGAARGRGGATRDSAASASASSAGRGGGARGASAAATTASVPKAAAAPKAAARARGAGAAGGSSGPSGPNS